MSDLVPFEFDILDELCQSRITVSAVLLADVIWGRRQIDAVDPYGLVLWTLVRLNNDGLITYREGLNGVPVEIRVTREGYKAAGYPIVYTQVNPFRFHRGDANPRPLDPTEFRNHEPWAKGEAIERMPLRLHLRKYPTHVPIHPDPDDLAREKEMLVTRATTDHNPPTNPQAQRLVAFLREYLADGPKDGNAVRDEAARRGLFPRNQSGGPMSAAVKELGITIQSKYESNGPSGGVRRYTTWSLPAIQHPEKRALVEPVLSQPANSLKEAILRIVVNSRRLDSSRDIPRLLRTEVNRTEDLHNINHSLNVLAKDGLIGFTLRRHGKRKEYNGIVPTYQGMLRVGKMPDGVNPAPQNERFDRFAKGVGQDFGPKVEQDFRNRNERPETPISRFAREVAEDFRLRQAKADADLDRAEKERGAYTAKPTEAEPTGKRERDPHSTDKVVAFLREALANGPRRIDEVKDEADKRGLYQVRQSGATLNSALHRLGVVTGGRGGRGPSRATWTLPESLTEMGIREQEQRHADAAEAPTAAPSAPEVPETPKETRPDRWPLLASIRDKERQAGEMRKKAERVLDAAILMEGIDDARARELRLMAESMGDAASLDAIEAEYLRYAESAETRLRAYEWRDDRNAR